MEINPKRNSRLMIKIKINDGCIPNECSFMLYLVLIIITNGDYIFCNLSGYHAIVI